MSKIKCSECKSDFQSQEEFEMHFTQIHGTSFGDVVRHFAYVEERITAFENGN